MSASGALKLAIALIEEHQVALGPNSQLVLVLDSELDQNHEIYEATLRRIGGTYIAVDRMDEPRVKGTLDLALKQILTESLRLSALGMEIEIQQEGEDVIVRHAGGIDPVNESERLILTFIASLFSQEFATHSVAALSWTDIRLEVLGREALWLLIRAQIAGRRLGSLTTLIFIAGGRIEPELHCEREPSVRFLLTERGLLKRKGRLSLDTAVGNLIRYPKRPVVLFLGAGASASARMPLGNDVRDYALEQFFSRSVPLPVTDLAFRFHQWVRENDRLLASEEGLDAATFAERLTLERVLREEFRHGREESPTLRHLLKKNANAIERKETRVRRALRTIIEKPQRLVIVTVNFDTILEDEFGDGLRVFATPEDFRLASSYIDSYIPHGGEVPVLKLHGSLAVPKTIVADVDTRSLGLPLGAAEALQHLRGDSNQRTPWVYIGASMRDPDVAQIIGAGEFAEGLDEWWVSPFPDPAVLLFVTEYRASRWQNAGRADLPERQITETADTFLSSLAQDWPD